MPRERVVVVTLVIEDLMDTDPEHETGLTTEAYERLTDAISEAGFSIKGIVRNY